MLKLEDLPQELRDALYITDCHISGMHDPTHTAKFVCGEQLRDMAKRVLKTLGIDLDVKDDRQRIIEGNKIPRRLEPGGWIEYYREQASGKNLVPEWVRDHPEEAATRLAEYKQRVDEYERWEREGIPVPPEPAKAG